MRELKFKEYFLVSGGGGKGKKNGGSHGSGSYGSGSYGSGSHNSDCGDGTGGGGGGGGTPGCILGSGLPSGSVIRDPLTGDQIGYAC